MNSSPQLPPVNDVTQALALGRRRLARGPHWQRRLALHHALGAPARNLVYWLHLKKTCS
ncbi:hypothetical protein [Streptomyces sp. NRRL S-1022]|uniref:hypothetical protein n=1 Tax=Streptomyces sp. NRRL S-1022 TaxID=1463880 RepID=UPI00131D2AD7|nr:hypothetical protein [Streptomyces sp. NRRL S-1022]